MKKIFKTCMAFMCCAAMVLGTTAFAGTVTDVSEILIDNCNVTLAPGRNIAWGGVAYLYTTDFRAAYLPVNSAPNAYVPDAAYPENAIDGNLDTYAQMGGEWTFSFVLDLQKEYEINRIALYFLDNGQSADYDILATTNKKPLISDTPGDATALQAWAQGLTWLVNETNNTDAGWHEFNFEPIKARYVVVRDNVSQESILRAMAIGEIEVNEVSKFYTQGENVLNSVSSVQQGDIKVKLDSNSGFSGGTLAGAVFDRETNTMVSNVTIADIAADGTAELNITSNYGNSCTDYTKTSLKNAYFKRTPDSTDILVPSGRPVVDLDLPGCREYSAAFGTPCGMLGDFAKNAFDGNELTGTAGSDWLYTLFAEFDAEKTVSAVDVTFSKNGVPIDYDIGVIDANGNKTVVKSVTGNTRGGTHRYTFEPVLAQKVYIQDKLSQEAALKQMSVIEFNVYDVAPRYELRAFTWNSLNDMNPLGKAITLQ